MAGPGCDKSDLTRVTAFHQTGIMANLIVRHLLTTPSQKSQAINPAIPVDARLAMLQKLPFFAGASEATMERLGSRALWSIYGADVVIINHGDKQDKVLLHN